MMTTNWPRAKGTWDMLDQKVTIFVPTSSTLVVKGTRKSSVCPDHKNPMSKLNLVACDVHYATVTHMSRFLEDSLYAWFWVHEFRLMSDSS